MRLLLPILLLSVFLGCASKVPMATKYKISVNAQEEPLNVKNSQCSSQSLKVMQAFSSSLLMSSDMYYILDSDKVFPYSKSEWAIAPNKMMSSKIYEMLRDMKLFKTVQRSKSRTNSSWLMESTLEDFMQYYENNNKESYVKISINLTIIDNNSSKVIASNVFKVKVKAKTMNAEGGVMALDKALSEILAQSASWFVKECK